MFDRSDGVAVFACFLNGCVDYAVANRKTGMFSIFPVANLGGQDQELQP